jgi:hypothetical protein
MVVLLSGPVRSRRNDLVSTSTLDLWLLLMTPGGCLLGGWSIYWARGQDHPARIIWGRRLFIVTLLLLGSLTLAAAGAHARGLAPLGLIAGFLVVGMLWESKQ